MKVHPNKKENDNVHRVRDELVRFGLINYIELIKINSSDSNKLAGTKIKYTSSINNIGDDAIAFFIGHEYGHYKLPQYSLLIMIIILLLMLIILLIAFTIKIPKPFEVAVLLLVILMGLSYKCLPKWLYEDEYRSDIFGAMILLEYGRIKTKKVFPSKTFKDLINSIHDSSINKSKINTIEIILRQKLDVFIHPPNKKRIKKLEKFEGLLTDI